MRKIFISLLTFLLALSLCACGNSDYQNAVDAMERTDYETAREIFLSMPEYQDSAELARECAYRMAEKAMALQDYARAYDLFAEAADYKDSAQKTEECGIRLGYQAADAMKEGIVQALAQRDEAQLCALVQGYLTMNFARDEISAHMHDFVMDTIHEQFETVDYENYLFLDRLIALTKDDEQLQLNFGSSLSEFDASHQAQRVMAFLTGTWRRVDSTQVNGLRIRVLCTEDNILSLVLEDYDYVSAKNARAKFHWDKGMPVWTEIQIADAPYITMDIMRLTCYYNLRVQSCKFEAGAGYLDFDGMRILTQYAEESDGLWQDHKESHIYVKESAIKDVPALTKEDFAVSFAEKNEIFGAKTADLNGWFSAQNTLFCAYNDRNALTTARGIKVGSDWLDVVEQYGYGRGNLYVRDEDPIYAALKESYRKDEASGKLLCDLLSDQADEHMDYPLNNTNRVLRFYFKDGKVSWICFYTK